MAWGYCGEKMQKRHRRRNVVAPLKALAGGQWGISGQARAGAGYIQERAHHRRWGPFADEWGPLRSELRAHRSNSIARWSLTVVASVVRRCPYEEEVAPGGKVIREQREIFIVFSCNIFFPLPIWPICHRELTFRWIDFVWKVIVREIIYQVRCEGIIIEITII